MNECRVIGNTVSDLQVTSCGGSRQLCCLLDFVDVNLSPPICHVMWQELSVLNLWLEPTLRHQDSVRLTMDLMDIGGLGPHKRAFDMMPGMFNMELGVMGP